MRDLMRNARTVLGATALCATAYAAQALTLTPFATNFNTPIGIDWYEPTSKLILSVNYPTGSPNNIDLVDVGTGTNSPYSSASGLPNEVKIATVRTSSCEGGFTPGDTYFGYGIPGLIGKIPAGATPLTPPILAWATLPGETSETRGSLFQDRFCAAGGDLIVVTGNEQNGTCPNDCIGNVWRVKSTGVATLVANIGTHLEGVTTLPNDPATYGPLAGRILAGAEQYAIPGGPPTYSATGGVIAAINPNLVNDWFTIGGPGTSGIGGHPHFIASSAFHPEDLDVIRASADFFGVNYGVFPAGHVLTAPASDFNGMCGQVLITQEFPFAGTSGLSALSWGGGTTFNVTPLPLSAGSFGPISQWEHVTFTSGADCFGLKVVKTPKSGTFAEGAQLTYTIVVTNTGALPDHINLKDQLPGNGGLVWASASATPQGTCTIVANLLSCDLGTVAAGASVTITVLSTATTPVAACQDQPNNLADLATGLLGAVATDNHGNAANDTGDLTCTPTLVTVTQGGWGSTPHGNNPGTILQNNFSKIGPVVIGCTTGFKDTFTSSTAIHNFLPQGGTPGVLTASATNPLTTTAGVFAGQVLALELNVLFSNIGVLPPGLGSYVITTGPAAGKTVAQVLADANTALGGCGLPSYVTSISQLNDVVTSINEKFDTL